MRNPVYGKLSCLQKTMPVLSRLHLCDFKCCGLIQATSFARGIDCMLDIVLAVLQSSLPPHRQPSCC